MNSNKYKILVLSDLKQQSNEVLCYAARLANEIDADLEVFYAKDGKQLLGIENAYVLKRYITETTAEINRDIKNLVTPVSEEFSIDIKTGFGLGHVKNEIKNYLLTSKPNVIVLGERKQKKFNFLGDNVTRFVQSIHQDLVVIATNENMLDVDGKVSLDNLGLIDRVKSYEIKTKTKTKQQV